MPKDPKRKFVNPLLQSTAPETLPATEMSTEISTLMAPATETSTGAATFPSTSSVPLSFEHRKRGAQAFEKTHERITLWIDRELKQQFEALANKHEIAKATLLNEAISDLLTKYQAREDRI